MHTFYTYIYIIPLVLRQSLFVLKLLDFILSNLSIIWPKVYTSIYALMYNVSNIKTIICFNLHILTGYRYINLYIFVYLPLYTLYMSNLNNYF